MFTVSAHSAEKKREVLRALLVGTALVVVGLSLQGCFGTKEEVADNAPPPSLVLQPSELTSDTSRGAAINYNRVARDCSGTYLRKKLISSTDEFRKEAEEQLKTIEEITEKQRKLHIDSVFPEAADDFFVNSADTGFLRKAEVYCHIRRHLNDMPGKAQLDSMVEEVQSRVSHITQFLPENAYGFLEAQNNTEALKSMKKYFKLSDLSDELFIKLRETVIPLKEEQMRTALYAISAFATGGCLRQYFEEILADEQCPWAMDNEPIVEEEPQPAAAEVKEEEKPTKISDAEQTAR